MANIPSLTPRLKFSNLPGFNPNYTPREILEFGVFGGSYFYSITSRKKLPNSLFQNLSESLWRKSIPDSSINYFEVPGPQRRRQLIYIDPEVKLLSRFGWFQWYCKLYYGTSELREDPIRAAQCIKELKVFVYYINLYCLQEGKLFSDLTVEEAKPWRQQMLQFGFDPTVNPFAPVTPPETDQLTYKGQVLTYKGEILTYGD